MAKPLMRDSIRLGRIAGIPFGLHWSLLVFAVFGVWNLAAGVLPLTAPAAGGLALLAGATVAIIGLFASIVAHELGHAVVARRHGVEVDGITLWMLGGVARLRDEPPSARAAGRIAGAGPVVSVVLGLGLVATTLVAAGLGVGALTTSVLAYLGLINIVLALFNLLPALPLDGGRLYQAWLWHRSGDRHRSTIRAARLGRTMGWGLVTLGLVQVLFTGGAGFWLVLLGAFIISLAGAERRRARAELRRAEMPVWFAGGHAPMVIDVRSVPVDTRFPQGSGGPTS